ncbi:MAG: SURF1 family protein [Alphaproteobacteria bacterium]
MTTDASRITFRRLVRQLPLVPSLITLAALAFLLGLGVWQLQRMQWKSEIIATIDAQMALPASPLPFGAIDVDAWRYRKAQVEGKFHHDKELHMYAASSRGNPGYQIITPLERHDGSFVFFNRGWVPMDNRLAGSRQAGQIEGPVKLMGLGRKPWPQNTFVADNEPQANIWFYGDLDEMAKFSGIVHYAPLFLEADETSNPGGLPLGGQSRVIISNDHLKYALTWFSLAIALIIVYGFYVAEQFRAR